MFHMFCDLDGLERALKESPIYGEKREEIVRVLGHRGVELPDFGDASFESDMVVVFDQPETLPREGTDFLELFKASAGESWAYRCYEMTMIRGGCLVREDGHVDCPNWWFFRGLGPDSVRYDWRFLEGLAGEIREATSEGRTGGLLRSEGVPWRPALKNYVCRYADGSYARLRAVDHRDARVNFRLRSRGNGRVETCRIAKFSERGERLVDRCYGVARQRILAWALDGIHPGDPGQWLICD